MKLENLTSSQKKAISEFGVNSWFVMDLLESYVENPDSVGKDWRKLFESLNIPINGKRQVTIQESQPAVLREKAAKAPEKVEAVEPKAKASAPSPGEGERGWASPIRGVNARIIENMTASLAIPTAVSLRTIPVKVLEENRRIINQNLKKKNSGKISYTHIIGWAMVKAIKSVPVMNNSYAVINGEPHVVKKQDVNLGIAIDIQKKEETHSLIVPNIKKVNTINFRQYFDAYNDLIKRARTGKIEISDFQGTTISLTNPGTVGTVSSSPRLMQGQGAIIATGAVDYPAEFQAATPEVRSALGISKVLSLTSTYDHRIIQGVESGMYLRKINELLFGDEEFYEQIFEDLEIPVKPVKWHVDTLSPLEAGQGDEVAAVTNIEEIEKQAKAIQLINMYRVRGHLLANLDPLNPEAKYHPELDPNSYGFTVWDYDRRFITDGLANLRTATLREILDILNQTYCDMIGVEFRHIQEADEKQWLQEKMEPVRNVPDFSPEFKRHILEKLIEAENFEKFIHKKYLGHKRFSLEGSETIIPVLDIILNDAAKDAVDELVLGLAHRGRLNVLANIIGKSMYAIFSEFEDIPDTESPQGSGDVKYHLGASGEYKTFDAGKVKVSVASNPSHLEFVNPVVEGIVRAKQNRMKDLERKRIIPILIHGDAAMAGEGIVAETINLSQLQGYSTGGTIHIIINNQIGFTTSPVDARSTVYPSDVAKMVQAPIFHVNGDDPEAALWVARLAYEYRQKFNKDVVIDVWGYRRLGHNEGDEPGFTQPLLYNKIHEHPTVKAIYQTKLTSDRIISEQEAKDLESKYNEKLELGYNKAKRTTNNKQSAANFKPDLPLAVSKEEIRAITSQDVKITLDVLNQIVEATTTFPEGFTPHPKLLKFIEQRREFLNPQSQISNQIDWSFAETLAFGTLLYEGINIRLSGQDSARGTFSQRHAVLTDAVTGKEIIPLNQLTTNNTQLTTARFEPLDSLLSEAAVLGFEYGYSTADPINLVLWEAQFGDFANAAQPIIDNFVAGSDYKWKVPTNLVLLLPHGQEGQGPEHSSARIERFLELCANGNMTVCYPSTPAQYYHLLRTQGKYKRRRPLIVFTPKSLLRHPEARSTKEEILNGSYRFVIDDSNYVESVRDGNLKSEIPNLKSEINRVLLTSGKVYYDLLKYRNEHRATNNQQLTTAIIRLERFYPFPSEEIRQVLQSYTNAKEIVWVQEEPENMGALSFIVMNLPRALADWQKLFYVTREPSPSPAPGSYSKYLETQEELCRKSFATL
jgi:2-oxoglutarate decarboxylase